MTDRTSNPGTKGVGASIAAAFIGLWVTFPLTGSVALAWVAFFVVGFATWAILNGQPSSTSQVPGSARGTPLGSEASSSYAQSPSTPSDERVVVPRPVGIVASQYHELTYAYIRRRSMLEPDKALAAALQDVLNADDHRDVVSFLNGEQDTVYGDASGEKLLRGTLENLEDTFRTVHEAGLG